ncbi:MAG: excinuclease ABC subunit UvrA [Planctomycetota bacterium]
MSDHIVIRGAAEHNLRDVDVDIPRNCLVVVTGLSGSGKSSLAYDVVYREGQRRFVESLSAYARQYLGRLDKPKVEHIEGLSPTISIDQKTISRNPRSTVGTITEILDHLRLLFARLGQPHCPECGDEIQSRTVDQIVDAAYLEWSGTDVLVAAPIVLDRKGEYRKELADLRDQGFVRVRIDGEIRRLDEEITLARYERHTIEVVYDRVKLEPSRRSRFSESVEKALDVGNGLVDLVVDGESHLRSSKFACPKCDVNVPELEPRLFSFNSPHGACPRCDGLGRARTVDVDRLVPDPALSLNDGAIATTNKKGVMQWTQLSLDDLEALGDEYEFDLDTPWEELGDPAQQAILFGTARRTAKVGAPAERRGRWRKKPKKRKRKKDEAFPGVVLRMEEAYRKSASASLEKWLRYGECPECEGSRLRAEPRSVLFRDRGIDLYSKATVDEAKTLFAELELSEIEAPVGRPVVREIEHRLEFMSKVGLGYLSLGRSADTLSGGEAQRIRLASQLGSGLRGVLYVLDEPSIGLHARDNRAMLETLRRLRDLGNSVLVVEHDEETIEAADFVVDVGPEAGVHGGRLISAGSVAEVRKNRDSLTGDYLSGRRQIEVPEERRVPSEEAITVRGARQHNLKSVDVAFPLGLFVALTGVSGSGKSTLVHQILVRAAMEYLGLQAEEPGDHDAVDGLEHIDKIIEIDQSPIGRTPRSNPGTYTKVFDEIRALYASTPDAKVRGYDKGRFSFNVKGGRCENCGGAGIISVSMQFLADVQVPCEECGGRRYNAETLEVTYRGRSISDVLDLPIEQALEFFQDIPKIQRTLQTLVDVGLGYVALGQPSTTLSGGEAQRVKLAHELRKSATGRTLYVLDEPTTGLHFEDIQRLLVTLGRLVDNGNTVVVIEHNLDVVKVADHVIDLGPEGGAGGGQVVVTGTPEEVAEHPGATGEALARTLDNVRPERSSKGKRRGASAEPSDRFRVIGARENNLKNLDVEVPRGEFTVITGPSGSGKSTLAFDILFAEGQRRYVESLSTYARRFLGRMQRAEVDRVEGIAPAIAIDQKNGSSSPRSTVATSTEIYDYLRLLYARVGTPHCPECEAVLQAVTPSAAARRVRDEFGDARTYVLAPLYLPGDAENVLGGASELVSAAADYIREGFVRVLTLAEGESVGTVHRLEELGDELPTDDRTEVHLVIDRLVPSKVGPARIAESIEEAYRRGRDRLRVLVVDGSRSLYATRLPSCPNGHFTWREEPSPRLFSFNHHSGACEGCHGLGIRHEVDTDALFTDPSLPPFEGAMDHPVGRWISRKKGRVYKVVKAAFEAAGLDFERAANKLTKKMKQILFDGTGDRVYKVRFRSMTRGMQYSSSWEGLDELLRSWHEKAGSPRWRRALEERMAKLTCSDCGGGRLRRELREVRIGGRAIHEASQLSIGEANRFFTELELEGARAQIAVEVLQEIRARLQFLLDVGLGYLTLDRATETLSGGEAQRIRLATQIGSHLVGVLYVLDEPTIGLHQRDTERLLRSLVRLRDLGNSVVTVEHDDQTIDTADYVIDLGPGAGSAGGEIVASGTPKAIRKNSRSLTGQYLSGRRGLPVPEARRKGDGGTIEIFGAAANSLRDIDVSIPTGTLTAISGVSGSGKSSLVMEILAKVARRHFNEARVRPGPHREVKGLDGLDALGIIDQSPLGRTPSSNPATYTKIFDAIRDVFAMVPEARARGYKKGRFSFNVKGGRCEPCEGKGSLRVEMHFLSDVWVPCEVCNGRRYSRETLEIRFKGLTIADVLDLEIEEAAKVFENHPRVSGMLDVLVDVGLGYIALGQSATTLSGGEAQRVKLAAELGKRSRGTTLYILDEPTTGLHFSDVERLVNVLHRLVDRGDTIVVIEHNLEVIKSADWVIDLGPEGGEGGGQVVAVGTPETVARSKKGFTAPFLASRLPSKTKPKTTA